MLLTLVRHGQSTFNVENRFTGDIDVPLTQKGKDEALQAGKKLQGFLYNIAFTSLLKRAQDSLEIILQTIGQTNIHIIKNSALNERKYGDLQGLNKDETAKIFGQAQVHIWRRSYDIRPPGGESLEDTFNRAIPYFISEIKPRLLAENNILIVAHGNSLRALVMYLEDINKTDIVEFNIPTGVPRQYQFDGTMKLLRVEYL